jgi:4-hydroxy-tetrahydrodipicolinate reductase
VAIAGAGGRMGRMLVEATLASGDLSLAAALDLPDSLHLGQDAGQALGQHTGVRIASDVAAALEHADVLIDFTRPEGTLAHLHACLAAGVGMVIGTTGFSPEQKATIGAAAKDIPVVFSPNMSVGVAVTFKLLAQAAQMLREGYEVEIIEAHHRHKVDAPSGTAVKMGEVVAQAQGTVLADRAVYAREGHTGPRRADAIGFATVRGGDIVGDHTVMFIGDGERIEITHKSGSRAGYAAGSLRAARFLGPKGSRTAGLYTMDDVLGLA